MKGYFDVVIKGGLVYDGGLSGPFVSDIGIADGKIAHIGRCVGNCAKTVIDAVGMAVCPGFIDTHAHSDFTIVADPRAEGKLCQGVTTEINGNCGMSAAPLYNQVYERREEDLRELGIRERWSTLGEYFSILERRGIAINSAFLAGHGNIRGCVVGYDNKEPSPEETARMSGLLDEALEQGAIGLSTGLIYPPGVYSKTEELVRLAGRLRGADLIYASHMRSEGNMLLEAVEEVLRIGREAGVKVHVSHLKTAGERNWGKVERVTSLLEGAARSGVRVTCDRYPYVASSTDLDSILPSWTYEGGDEEELRRISGSKERNKIAAEIREQSQSPGYWEKVMVSSVVLEKNKWMEGKTIAEISKARATDEIETLFDILIDEKLRVGAIFRSMTEENLRKFLALPFCMIGTDSSARCFEGPTKQGKPHPRGFGTFPRLMGKYVREERLFSLTVAVHKATALAARTFGLSRRGMLKAGNFADIVVFDPGAIGDRATFEDPFQKPAGIAYVLVNGTVALCEGDVSGRCRGRVLRRSSN
ncbi:MAG: D-aminoacylase [Nitrospiraceae bacterium]|nr:D-aminoacylase [Nitrospiraceae bacterium]